MDRYQLFTLGYAELTYVRITRVYPRGAYLVPCCTTAVRLMSPDSGSGRGSCIIIADDTVIMYSAKHVITYGEVYNGDWTLWSGASRIGRL